MTNPRILIVYICYNSLAYLDEVVASMKKISYPKDRTTIMFVPNGSPDGITEAIKERVMPLSGGELPECILVEDGVNRGFAGGNNHGIEHAINEEYDYVFLHNGDLKLEESTLDELVTVAQKNTQIGSAQALVLHWNEPERINTSGGVFHVAGYGYARDNLKNRDQVTFPEVEEIMYASGAAVLYRVSALARVGGLEEGFFMYHEDLELGMRLKMAGYINVLASSAIAYHDYSFSRNPMKFAWMELYRWIVVLAYYRLPTLVLLWPLLMVIEMGSWLLAITGGWKKAKIWQYKSMLQVQNWKLLLRMRKRAQGLRQISDRSLLHFVSGRIEAQEKSSFIVEKIANPIVDLWFKIIRFFIFW